MRPEPNHSEFTGSSYPGETHAQDASIDLLLQTLTRQAPAPGLETRVLRALTRRNEAKIPRLSRWPVMLAAVMALVFFSFLAASRHWPARRQFRTAMSTAVKPGSGPVLAEASTMRHTRLRGQAGPALPAAVAVLRPRARRVQAAPFAPPGPALSRNIPAPALPLTAQEQLLLQYVHRRDPKELAALTPSASLLHDKAERAAYDQFFAEPPPPPPPPETPSGDPAWLPAL
jgi:hypothetical protein